MPEGVGATGRRSPPLSRPCVRRSGSPSPRMFGNSSARVGSIHYRPRPSRPAPPAGRRWPRPFATCSVCDPASLGADRGDRGRASVLALAVQVNVSAYVKTPRFPGQANRMFTTLSKRGSGHGTRSRTNRLSRGNARGGGTVVDAAQNPISREAMRGPCGAGDSGNQSGTASRRGREGGDGRQQCSARLARTALRGVRAMRNAGGHARRPAASPRTRAIALTSLVEALSSGATFTPVRRYRATAVFCDVGLPFSMRDIWLTETFAMTASSVTERFISRRRLRSGVMPHFVPHTNLCGKQLLCEATWRR